MKNAMAAEVWAEGKELTEWRATLCLPIIGGPYHPWEISAQGRVRPVRQRETLATSPAIEAATIIRKTIRIQRRRRKTPKVAMNIAEPTRAGQSPSLLMNCEVRRMNLG